jgi:branched-chain amino acid transport system permease protein
VIKKNRLEVIAIVIMVFLFFFVGIAQSWSLSLAILNMCIISAVMSLGINIQWGYAGIFNVGIMGFTALGGLAAVLVSYVPVVEAWHAGGLGMVISLFLLISLTIVIYLINKLIPKKPNKYWLIAFVIIIGIIVINLFYKPAVIAIEAVDPATTGFLGGMGLPIIFSWVVGGLFAAGVAFVIGKITLGLRSDYLAIATLGISEIIISVLKHEDWLSRGVKNVIGLKRPVPYEINLQQSEWFISMISYLNKTFLTTFTDLQEKQDALNLLVINASGIFVKLNYAILFSTVLLFILYLANKAQISPWGRMMRAIRDNEISANAMGKDIVKRHLQIFVIGSAVVGISGAMLVTLDGLFTPASYQPLRYTFLIWIMVILGGSGNNLGSILGGFIVWFVWIEAAPASKYFIELFTSGMSQENNFKLHLINSVPYFRYLIMGSVLLLIMRYRPGGILPEKIRHS